MDGSNAPKWHKSRLDFCRKHSFPRGRCIGVFGIDISTTSKPKSCVICTMPCIIDAPRSASKYIVFIYYVEILIALPCPRVTFCCIIIEKHSYTCMETRLRTLISDVPLVSSSYCQFTICTITAPN